MIKNILIAALFIALSAFAISATLKSSPGMTPPAKEPIEYAKKYVFSSIFKEEAEAKLKKETGIVFSIPDTLAYVQTKYVVSIKEGTVAYSFWYESSGYTIEFFSKK